MLAFLADCPIGLENEAIMVEACEIDAIRTSRELDTCYRLDALRDRTIKLNASRYEGRFDDLCAFYEDTNAKSDEVEQKKKGLIAKAWEKIKNFFHNLGNMFKKQGKLEEDNKEVAVPSLIGEGINLIASFTSQLNAITGGAISVAAIGGLKKAVHGVVDFITNKWEKNHGPSVKKRKKELNGWIASLDSIIATFETVTGKLGDAEDSLSEELKKEAEKAKENAEAEKEKLDEESKDSNIFGKIRGAITKVGSWVKSARNLIFKKANGEGESSEGDDSDKKDNNDDTKKTDDNSDGESEDDGKSGNDGNKGKSGNDDSGGGDGEKPYYKKDGVLYKRVKDGDDEEVSDEDAKKVDKDDIAEEGFDDPVEFDLDTFFEDFEDGSFDSYSEDDILEEAMAILDEDGTDDLYSEEEIYEDAMGILNGGDSDDALYMEDNEPEPWEAELNTLYEELVENA